MVGNTKYLVADYNTDVDQTILDNSGSMRPGQAIIGNITYTGTLDVTSSTPMTYFFDLVPSANDLSTAESVQVTFNLSH